MPSSAMKLLLTLLLVYGCMGASLREDATPTTNYETGNGIGYESEAPSEKSPTINERLTYDQDKSVPSPKGNDLNPASSMTTTNVAVDGTSKGEANTNDATMIGNRIASMGAAIDGAKQATAMVDSSSKHNAMEEGTTALRTTSSMKGPDLEGSTVSIRIIPEDQAMTKTIKAVSAEDQETSAPDMKPMPTLGYGVSTNSMGTVVKPMPTIGYGVSTNSSMVPVMKPMSILGYGVSGNGSMATTVKLSSQGNVTSMTSSMTTQASKATTSGNAVTTTAPKKNGGSSTSVSILFSVVPVVISLVLNH